MANKLVDKFPFFNLALSQKYHQGTKREKFGKTAGKNVDSWPKEWVEVNYKGYPRFEKIPLTKSRKLKTDSFVRILIERHSFRDFTSKSMTFDDLSTLLYYSVGLKDESGRKGRFYPSAGARYPTEVYPLVFNVNGIRKGIYHYHLRTHSLEYLWSLPNLKNKVMALCFDQTWIKKASVLLILSAVFWRNEVKYSDRGYRHVMMETGIITQNIYLISQALGLGCCAVAGFVDDAINKLLDIDGLEESTTSVLVIGTKE